MSVQHMVVFGDVRRRQYAGLQDRFLSEDQSVVVARVNGNELSEWTTKMNRELEPDRLFEQLYDHPAVDERNWLLFEDVFGIKPEHVVGGIIDRKCAEGGCNCNEQIEVLGAQYCASATLFAKFAEISQPGFFVSVSGRTLKMHAN